MLTVHVRINDAATGKPTPVRLRIADPSGRGYPPLGRFEIFPTGAGESVGGNVLVGGAAWWVIDGSCEVPLPAALPLRIQAVKGPEYAPLDETATLGPGQMALRFAIHRRSDLRAEGWRPGDSRCLFLSPHDALLEAAAEDLDVVNLLIAEEPLENADGRRYRTVRHLAAFSGQTAALESHGRFVAVNSSNRHALLGQVGLLYSHRPVFPLTFGGQDDTDDWSIADWCDQCRRKGGLTVWVDAFREPLVGGEALVAAILGKIDAIEITEYVPLQMEWVYRLWNAGFRIPLIGGSGKESNATPLGAMRTYAHIGQEPFSYKAWIEAVRAGRSFVTNGPLVSKEWEPIAGNGWSAMRFLDPNGGFAHTSPVIQPPKRPPSREDAEPLVRAVQALRRWIETAGRFEQPKRKQAHLDRCREALERLALGAEPRPDLPGADS